jgi:hypothetical protein
VQVIGQALGIKWNTEAAPADHALERNLMAGPSIAELAMATHPPPAQ